MLQKFNFISKFDNEENTVSFYSMNRFEKVSQNQIGKQIIFVSIIMDNLKKCGQCWEEYTKDAKIDEIIARSKFC